MAIKGLFDKFKRGLEKTRTSLFRSLETVFTSKSRWGDAEYEILEEALIGSDIGPAYTMQLVDDIRDRYERGQIQTAEDILGVIREDVSRILKTDVEPFKLNANGPTVILMVGVNGAGKTTTTGKLGKMFKDSGKSVMYAACDTFRAAAIEQLKIWGERTDCPVIAGKHGADAASVAYDACKSASAKNIDVLLIDTAGRQHTNNDLMKELDKLYRTIDRALPGAPHESWIVIDSSAGSNGLSQAKQFTQVTPLTGICLTKLDGTSKGGIVVAIYEEQKLPIRYIGLGEGADDLQPFEADLFANALFPKDLL